MTIKKIMLLALVLFTATSIGLAIASEKPSPQTIPEGMSCGVCGMHPAKFVKWQSQVIFTDNKMVPFDGCKCMFKYILNMSKHDKDHSAKDIAAIWVKDYTTGNWLDGKEAIYLVGSKEMGPMGKELIPFADHAGAADFQKTRTGMIMKFGDISMDDIKKLGGMKMKGMKMNGMKKGQM